MPKSKEELQAMMFGEEKFYPNPYIWGDKDPYGWPATDVAETVWNDLQGEDAVINVAGVQEVGKSGYIDMAEYPDFPSYSNVDPEENRKKWDEYYAMKEGADAKVVNDFLASVPEGSVFAHFEYSDNDGAYFTALEHGPLFSKIKHLRVSHH